MIYRDKSGAVFAMLQELEAGGAVRLRTADGAAVQAQRRAELLSRARAGDVEPIEFDARVYRQKAGEPLTPGVRSMQQWIQIRAGGMAAHARSYRGLPFLSGHDVGDVTKRAGSISDSWLDRGDSDDDEMIIRHTFQAVAPWAVGQVLDGTIDRFSIHFAITGEITCSVHKARIWSKCYCMPGQLTGDEKDQNRPRAFWIVENATGRETSAVNVPAVGNGATGIEALRFDAGGHTLTGAAAADLVGLEVLAELAGVTGAQFREALADARATVYDVPHRISVPVPGRTTMKMNRLAAALGITLAANQDLDEDQALAALGGITASAKVWEGRALAAEAEVKLAAAAKTATEIDTAIAAAYSAGRLVRRQGADGKPVADSQEAGLREYGTALGAAKLGAYIETMPVRAPAQERQADRVPAPKAGALSVVTGSAMQTAQIQCGLTDEEMAESAAALGVG